jgi:hypothetical protein
MRRIVDSKPCVQCGLMMFRTTKVAIKYWNTRRFCSHACEGEFKRTDRHAAFLDKCIPEPNSGCWLWLGQIGINNGYGYFWDGEKQCLAHVFSHRIHKGDVEDGPWILHHCDNRACVNPDHLYAGQPIDNGGDMVRRGRSLFGERQNLSKLTEPEVKAIIASPEPSKVLAERYSVGDGHIWSIRTRKSWKYLDRVKLS